MSPSVLSRSWLGLLRRHQRLHATRGGTAFVAFAPGSVVALKPTGTAALVSRRGLSFCAMQGATRSISFQVFGLHDIGIVFS